MADNAPPGRETMPTYEYLCNKCGEEFIRIMSLHEYETGKVSCPKCGSEEVKQQMSAFTPKTSRKS
jgi:putative FmdB family regulatory protein